MSADVEECMTSICRIQRKSLMFADFYSIQFDEGETSIRDIFQNIMLLQSEVRGQT